MIPQIKPETSNSFGARLPIYYSRFSMFICSVAKKNGAFYPTKLSSMNEIRHIPFIISML
jgi:hypothetical protein